MVGNWWEADRLLPPIRDYLYVDALSLPLAPLTSPPYRSLRITLAHRHQYQMYFHLPTFFASVSSNDPSRQPHPALLEAMYLLACYYTETLPRNSSYNLTGLEAHFLNRTRKALNDSVAYCDRLLDFLKASCLVTTYFMMRGRFLEG